jgi:small subunit ribosomal protein S16
MVKIRLARGGSKNKPFFRIVAIDSRRKRGGKPLEVLGFWQPAIDDKRGKRVDEGVAKIDRKKVQMWIDKGAQLTKVVKLLLK